MLRRLFENPDVPEDVEYVLVLEPDMLLRRPINCLELGVRPGVVVSAPYSYLSGTSNGMAANFIDKEAAERVEGVGGFHCFHIDDLRKVAPRWLELTKAIRKNPQHYWRIDGVGEDFDTGAQLIRCNSAAQQCRAEQGRRLRAQVARAQLIRCTVPRRAGAQTALASPRLASPAACSHAPSAHSPQVTPT